MEDEYYDTEQKRGWHVLFQKLHQTAKAQAGPQTEARKPTNIPRNRYRDVLPSNKMSIYPFICLSLLVLVDETRVKLNSDECDYINANFVKVC
jgi:protein tyrosine phosphatase